MYLRLRMGRETGKNVPLPTTVMSYGKNKLRPEYWFSVPKNKWVFFFVLEKFLRNGSMNDLWHRVDELYRFFGAWIPHLYGELDEEAIKIRGYELIQHDTEWADKANLSKVSATISPIQKMLY